MELKSRVAACAAAIFALSMAACSSTPSNDSSVNDSSVDGMGSAGEQSGDQASSSLSSGLHSSAKPAGMSSSSDANSSESMTTSSSNTAPQSNSSASAPGSSAPFSRAQLLSEMALNELHHLNQKEIQMAQLAQEKSESPQIKQHAQRILSDHQAMETRVQEVAQSKSVQLQDFQPSTYEKSSMDRLRGLSGREFDHAFHWQMRDGHQRAIQMLQLQRKNVKDREITSLISQALPKIRQHEKLSHRPLATSSAGRSGEMSGEAAEVPSSSPGSSQ